VINWLISLVSLGRTTLDEVGAPRGSSRTKSLGGVVVRDEFSNGQLLDSLFEP
jgi:hypothetical protein